MLKKLLITSLVIIVIAAGGFGYLYSKYTFITVNGLSMSPTFANGDVIVLSKEDSFERGQIVLFKLPNSWKDEYKGNDDHNFVKRINAAPGDTVAWNGQEWSVNGEIFAYVKTGSCEIEPGEVTLKENEIFVTGDTTTDQTMDSREAFCKGLPFLVTKDEVLAHGEVVKVL